MKLRTFLSIFLFCSPLLALGTNNLTVARAESASETETINAVTQNDNETKFILSSDFSAYNSNATSCTLTGSVSFTLTGGQYIQSNNSYYIKGGTDVVFKILMGRKNSKLNTTKNLAYFNVISVDGTTKYSASEYPSGTSFSEYEISVAVETTGNYYFNLGAYKTSDSSTCNKIKKMSITYTPYVEEPATPDISSDKFATEKTLSQMAFSYTKSVEGETTSYNVDEVVLRYGAKVDYANMWSSLDVKGYGVAVAKTNDLDGSSLTDLLNNKDLSDETVRAENENIKFAVGDLENVTRVNENDGLLVEDLEGQYVLFNARIVVPEGDYDTAVSALAYVVFEEDGMNKLALFQEVVGDSVANEANYYLNNGEQYNADVRNVLSSLAD